MLKGVQHDMPVRFWSFCHPEPGPEPCPETSSGSIEFNLRFRDLVFWLMNLGFKAPPRGGVLYFTEAFWF